MIVHYTVPGGESRVGLEPELNRLAALYRSYLRQLQDAKGKPILRLRIMKKVDQLQARILTRLAGWGVSSEASKKFLADLENTIIKEEDNADVPA